MKFQGKVHEDGQEQQAGQVPAGGQVEELFVWPAQRRPFGGSLLEGPTGGSHLAAAVWSFVGGRLQEAV